MEDMVEDMEDMVEDMVEDMEDMVEDIMEDIMEDISVKEIVLAQILMIISKEKEDFNEVNASLCFLKKK